MRFRASCWLLISLLLAPSLDAGEIAKRIARGTIDEIRTLTKNPPPSEPPGDLLYAKAILEPSLGLSLRLLESASTSQSSLELTDAISVTLAQAYLAAGDSAALRELYRLSRGSEKLKKGAVLQIGLLAYSQSTGTDAIEIERLLTGDLAKSGTKELQELFALEKGIRIASDKANSGKMLQLKSLSTSRHERVAAPALYALALTELSGNRSDDALLTYNLLKESNGDAVGLTRLIDQFSGERDEGSIDNRAERVTGTYYSVQVGVFAEKANALDAAAQFKSFKQPVSTEQKLISGKKYHVVLIGRFPSFDAASDFKVKLEQAKSASYQVVAR